MVLPVELHHFLEELANARTAVAPSGQPVGKEEDEVASLGGYRSTGLPDHFAKLDDVHLARGINQNLSEKDGVLVFVPKAPDMVGMFVEDVLRNEPLRFPHPLATVAGAYPYVQVPVHLAEDSLRVSRREILGVHCASPFPVLPKGDDTVLRGLVSGLGEYVPKGGLRHGRGDRVSYLRKAFLHVSAVPGILRDGLEGPKFSQVVPARQAGVHEISVNKPDPAAGHNAGWKVAPRGAAQEGFRRGPATENLFCVLS